MQSIHAMLTERQAGFEELHDGFRPSSRYLTSTATASAIFFAP